MTELVIEQRRPRSLVSRLTGVRFLLLYILVFFAASVILNLIVAGTPFGR